MSKMDDDEVTRLLTEEALDSSNRYLMEGLGAYRPNKPTGNAPKPNTRFLRHLIKETDNHNTALKRKEEREARERMRDLRTRSATPQVHNSHSRRSDRLSTRNLEKRDRHERDDKSRTHRRRSCSPSPSQKNDKSRRYRHRDERDRHGRKDDRPSHRERERDTRPHSSRKDRHDRHRSYSRSRSRSPRRDRHSKPSSYQSTRDSAHRSRRDQTSSRPHRSSRPERSRQSSPSSASPGTLQEDDRNVADESDPLEDLVGPLPPATSSTPIRPRGRGAYKAQASNIDAHFAADYDPSLDVQPDEDEDTTTKLSARRRVPGLMTQEDDWDMALEALRDRTKWRQKGEERLRAAGINEGAIDRWKNPATSSGTDPERRPEDVQWSKKGEGREWDRGKFVDDQGHIDVRAQWSK